MNRRRLLGLASTVGISAVAGCSNLFGPDPKSLTNGSDGGGSSKARITQVEGTDTDTDQKIDILRAHIIKKGSGTVDLSKATYILKRFKRRSSQKNIDQTAHVANGGGSGVTYQKVAGGNGNSAVLQQREDKVVVQFDLTAIDGIKPLEPEAEMEFEIKTTRSIPDDAEALQAPPTIKANKSYYIQ
jgi:hypothetical protein